MMQRLTLALVISLLMGACTTPEKTPSNPQTPPSSNDGGTVAPTPTPSTPSTGKYKNPGWHRDFDLAIEGAVTARMRSVPASRMQVICPAWAGMNDKHKNQFYSDLLFAIAKFESSYNTLAMYRETTMSADSVTGKQVISESMLQLSYQDEGWAKCGFDYAKDKASFADDEKRLANHLATTGKQSLNSVHPERTILDPILNLKCGVKIIDYRLGITSEPNKSQEMLTLLRGRQDGTKMVNGKEVIIWKGGYWAVLRNHWTEIKAMIRERGSQCY